MAAHQAPLSMGFPRQEYRSGFSFPSLGDLPHPGIEPKFPALQVNSLPTEPPEVLKKLELERCYGEGGGRGVHVWERM